MLTHYLTKKNEIVQRLKDARWPESNHWVVADWLLRQVLGSCENSRGVVKEWSAECEQHLERLLHELLVERKPLAYVLGYVPFGGLRVQVRPPTLIPRPETEAWVLDIIEQLRVIKRPLQILDMCTGSGCIALALARAFPESTVVGVDVAATALDLANDNKKALGVNNVCFIQSNLFSALQGSLFDVIVSNPPYIAHDDWKLLDPMIRDWEDRQALIADQHGFALIYAIIEQAPLFLTAGVVKGRQVFIEIGSTQAQAVCTKFAACGYTEVAVQRDLAGLDRMVMARYQKGSACTQMKAKI